MELGFDELTLRGRLELVNDVTLLGSNRPSITEAYEVDAGEFHKGLYNRFYGVTVQRIYRKKQHHAAKMSLKNLGISVFRRYNLTFRTMQQTSLWRVVGFSGV
jgi:hypothetical protein